MAGAGSTTELRRDAVVVDAVMIDAVMIDFVAAERRLAERRQRRENVIFALETARARRRRRVRLV